MHDCLWQISWNS